MNKGLWLVVFWSLFAVSPHTFADYYLKFETSGGSHNPDTLFSTNTNTWIKVSIVDVYPTDGPVHYPGSNTGAFTRFNNKVNGTDHLRFYYAEVPRSVTIIDKSDGTRTTVKAGDDPETFDGAPSPAFYMPDTMLITTGLSQDFNADIFKVDMAATMPMTLYGDQGNPFGIAFKSGSNYRWDYSYFNHSGCAMGWAPSFTHGEEYTMVQAVSTGTGGNGKSCYGAVMSKGKISHVIRFQ